MGDTDSTAALFTDEELQVYIDNRANNILLAAADACDQLATRYGRAYDFATDDQKFTRSQMVKAYADRAKELRARAYGVTTVDSTRIDGYSRDVANQDTFETDTNPRRRYYGPRDRPS